MPFQVSGVGLGHLSLINHIPGEKGLPGLGHMLEILAGLARWETRMRRRYGEVYRYNALFQDRVNLRGPDAIEFVLVDRDQAFSSYDGYPPLFGPLAPPGFTGLIQFTPHQAHRQIILEAFKSAAMAGYLGQLVQVIHHGWPGSRRAGGSRLARR